MLSVDYRLECRIHPAPKGAGILLALYKYSLRWLSDFLEWLQFARVSTVNSAFDDGLAHSEISIRVPPVLEAVSSVCHP